MTDEKLFGRRKIMNKSVLWASYECLLSILKRLAKLLMQANALRGFRRRYIIWMPYGLSLGLSGAQVKGSFKIRNVRIPGVKSIRPSNGEQAFDNSKAFPGHQKRPPKSQPVGWPDSCHDKRHSESVQSLFRRSATDSLGLIIISENSIDLQRSWSKCP